MLQNQDFLKCCQNRLSEILNRNIETIPISKEVLKQQCSINTPKNVFHKLCEELPVTAIKTSNPSETDSPVHKRIKLLNSYGKTPPLNIVCTKLPDKKLLGQFKTPTRHP